MVIANNMAAMSALNEANRNTDKLGKALKQAASGMKVNGAGDDASAYSISERMRVQIRALDQDVQNVKTGRNLIATAEGGIQNIVENLRYLKEKALNAADDHNTDEDRAFIQKEVNARLEEINEIAHGTTYNGRILLNGDYDEPVIEPPNFTRVNGITVTNSNLSNMLTAFTGTPTATQTAGVSSDYGIKTIVGYYAPRPVITPGNPLATPPTSTVYGPYPDLVKLDFSALVKKDGSAMVYPDDLDGEGMSLQCNGGCGSYTNILFDADLDVASSYGTTSPVDSDNPAHKGKWKYTYVVGVKNVQNAVDLRDAIYTGITSSGGNTITGYGHGLEIHKDSNGDVYFNRTGGSSSSSHLLLLDQAVGEAGLVKQLREYVPLIIHSGTKANQHMPVWINGMQTHRLGIEPLEVNPREKARAAIQKVDDAIDYALNEATRMGAYYKKLEFTEDNLESSSENTTNAESTIRDADMAKVMTDYTKNNILQQSAQAMLAQANQNSSQAISLLQG